MNATDIQQLIAEQVQESLYLDFKRGDSLNRQNNARSELIKDVTGLANADGGRLIYGIAEKRSPEGIPVADALAPITDTGITKEWVSQVIRDNTGPRFLDFDIEEVAVAGGRALVIDVRVARTAHQNHYDQRYYQRGGVVTAAIQDFQIRDLMARQTRPLADVQIQIKTLVRESSMHRSLLAVSVENIGSVTLEKWWLTIVLPERVLRDSRKAHRDAMRDHQLFEHMVRVVSGHNSETLARISLGDPFVLGQRYILHPGQSQAFDSKSANFPEFIIEIREDDFQHMQRYSPPINWTLYLNNSNPIGGKVPFSTWCSY